MATKRPAPIRILVVDDHRTFAEALAMGLQTQPGFSVATAGNGPQAVEVAARFRPNVVLMDMQMPGMGGVEAIRRVREVDREIRVVVVSAFDEEILQAQAIEAGAVGFLTKQTALADLPGLVRRVHAGEALVDRQEYVCLLRVLRRRRHQEATERQRANRLTPRQIEILQLMADGVDGKEIARRLEMSPLTLRTHVQNILTRLAVHRKDEALVVAIRHGKISAGS